MTRAKTSLDYLKVFRYIYPFISVCCWW